MNHRPDRVADLIQEELGKLMQCELDFDDALVTITSVEVSQKLEFARVKVGIIPPSAVERAMGTLKNKQGFLQHLLNRTLNIRPMPRIEFVHDAGAERAASVEKILMGEDNEGASEKH